MHAERTCAIDRCHRKAHARGLCGSHYSTWYRRTNGRKRKTFSCICEVCGDSFTAYAPNARYCSTGPNSCEARGKKGIILRTGQPAAVSIPAAVQRLRNSPLFNPHRGPSEREIAAYRRVLKRDVCAYCGA